MMNSSAFAGIYVFDRDRARSAGLLRGLLARGGGSAAARPSSPAPGLALPPGSPFTRIRALPGSWLQLAGPHADGAEAAGLYLEDEAAFPAGLCGEFAFALYDARDAVLRLGSDRFSEIPVFYALFRGGIAWADEPSLLRRLPGVDGAIDPRAVDRYVTMRYVPSPFTLYKGVRKLPPASVLTVRHGRPELSRYWTPPMKEERWRSLGEASEAVQAALAAATKARLRGVRRAAAVVSGGLDSSSVSALAVRCGVEVRTFTVSVPGDSESDFGRPGRVLAEAIGSRHTVIDYKDPDEAEIWGMSAAYGEPQSDQCAVPLWVAAGRMKGCAPVLFSGDGGDENFGGYGRARLMLNMVRDQDGEALEALLRKALTAGDRVAPAVLRRIRGTTDNRLKTIYSELSKLYFGDTGDFYDAGERRALYSPGFAAALGPGHTTSAEAVRNIFRDTLGQDWLSRITLQDLCAFHPECTGPRLRVTAARAGMRAVLPFNDHRLVELARGLPEKWKLPPGTLSRSRCKWVLRKAMERRLPRAIVFGAQRPFATPVGRWLAGSLNGLFRDALLSGNARTAAFFRRRAVERILAEHVAGRKGLDGKLWTLLMLELWMRTH